MHIQQNTRVTSFKTCSLRSLPSSLLLVKYNYCRKSPDFQALPYTCAVSASLPTLHLISFPVLPHLSSSCTVPQLPPPSSCPVLLPCSGLSGTSCRGRTALCFGRNKVLQCSTQPALALKTNIWVSLIQKRKR